MKSVTAKQPPLARALPKRILLLQSTSVFQSFGGIEYYLDDFSALCAKHFGAEHFCALVPKKGTDFPLVERDYRWEGIPFSANRWVSRIQNRFSVPYFERAYQWAKKWKPSLIVCGHVSLGPLAKCVSRLTGIPYVSLVYGIESWGGLWPQDEWALRGAKGIISISEWTKKILVERGIPSEKIQILHPQLPRDYEKIPKPIRPRESKTVTLLTVSRLDANEQYKGHDHVLEALHRLKQGYHERPLELKYIIQGDGTDRSRLEELVEDLELEDWVEFRGSVSNRSQFASSYGAADIFVMPARFGKWEKRWRGEGFGIVYLEAAAFGVPSIAYDCGGVTDIITSHKNGILVEPDNISELARSIEYLAKNSHVRFQMGQEAYQMCMDRFTRASIDGEFVTAFNRFSK